MAVTIGILFWVLVLVLVIWGGVYWRTVSWPVYVPLLLACIILLGIATFGGLHLVR